VDALMEGHSLALSDHRFWSFQASARHLHSNSVMPVSEGNSYYAHSVACGMCWFFVRTHKEHLRVSCYMSPFEVYLEISGGRPLLASS
jgi:hypothetical protein